MIRCIAVDDEPLALQVLQGHISRMPELKLVASCSNALAAFEVLNHQQIDLIFLDIQMPSITGLDFIKSLKSPPAVIFTTAFSEYAVQSYEVNAVDYLLKPVTFERFNMSLQRFANQTMVTEPVPDYCYFKVNGRMIKLMHVDILFAQSIKDYVIIHASGGRYITHMTMKYLAELLPVHVFRRVHRSYLVGINHITSLGRNSLEVGDTKIPVGESYKVDVGKIIDPGSY